MTTQPGSGIGGEFEQVIKDFRATAALTQKEQQDFQFTKLEDVQMAMGALQKQQSQNKRLRYMKRLEPFLHTMVEYGKVIEVFVNASEILAFVWIASTLSKAFSSLLDMYEYVGNQIPLLSSYQYLFSENAHMRSLLVAIFTDILTFHKDALRFFRQKLWKQLFDATWKGFVSKVENLKETMKCYRRLIEGRATLVEFEEVQNLRRITEANFQDLYKADLTRRREAVLRWLSPGELEYIHERHVTARCNNPVAGKWLISHANFQKWFDPLYCSTPLLWLNGKPGAGKSVLASVIIDEARKVPDTSMAFFYCAENDPLRNKFLSIARGLLSQLLVQDEDLILLIHDRMSTKSGDATLSSTILAKELLHIALKRRKIYIVLDGIDECARDQRKEICTWFRGVVDSLSRTQMDEIRCLFISQDDGIARKDLSMLPSIKVTIEDNRCDIEAFANIWKYRIEEKFAAFTKEELDIPPIVTARSQGMFIYAKCVLKELFEQPSRHALLAEWKADNFPNGLDEVYQRILRRVLGNGPDSQHKTTTKLLAWISNSKRPLRWYEIQAAISIDLDEPSINDENRRLVNDSKDLCASLVEVYPDQTAVLGTTTPTTLRPFVFLLREKIVNPAEVDRELCSLSIAYLCFPSMDPELESQAVQSYLLAGSYSFYEYAVACWVPHLLAWLPQAKSEEVQDLSGSLETLLDLHYLEPAEYKTASKSIGNKLNKLESLDIYDSLAQCIVWTRKLLMADKVDGPDNLMDFQKITAMIRLTLEQISLSNLPTESKERLDKYYGTERFKCPQVYCQHFYRGFQKLDDRKAHIDRHDRPYICTVDSCTMATFGCVSKTDLEKHMLNAHGMYINDAENFPDPSDPSEQHIPNSPGKFACTHCDKAFPQRHILKNHLRAHRDRRRFDCNVCGKSFFRKYDKDRHERLHGEKKFACQGHRIKWGCGKRFAREDALKEHLMSKTSELYRRVL
ncbi:hypothetical protein F4781DRAFT_421113 [Annulohypoxylon bovei var. microspora]|nr:hypothetical protein F4781DRAFT_421113 [Annulohypoxylon bovei var. microspora]